MVTQQPVFPGNDYIHQLKLIVSLIGFQRKGDLWFVTNENARKFVLQLSRNETHGLKSRFAKAPPDAYKLLAKMLVFNPKKRLRMREALNDNYVERYLPPKQHRH